jgi:predicted RND superfamily exporter protein
MDKYLKFIISSSKLVIFGLLVVLAISSNGINNFKLDASSDALVIEGDASLKKFREAEKEFGGSDFLIVVIEPHDEIFSNTTIETIKSLELEIENIKGIESVLSLVDAPIFFQPKVPLVDVSDNLKDLDDPAIDLTLAKDEFLDNPIYKDLIISADGKTTAMQINLLSNDRYNNYIEERYDLLDKDDTAGLNELNKKISDLNDEISQNNALIIKEIREVLNEFTYIGKLYLGGPSMIATDMMTYIKDDLVVFGVGVAFVFAIMLYLFFGNVWFVLLPLINSFFATFITAAFLGAMDWKISVVSSNFIALLLILTISLTVHVLVKFNELRSEYNDRTDRLKNAIRKIIVPCFFAAFTTGIAFISLLVGELKPVIEFGKMMSVGILIAFICTFTFIPAALSLIKNTDTKDVLELHRITSVLYEYTVKNTKLIFLISLISIFVFIYGAFKLEVENKFIDYFDDTTEIYQGMLKIDKDLGGTATLDIIIKEPKEDLLINDNVEDEIFLDDLFEDENSQASGYWWNIYSLSKLEEIHDYLDDKEEIGKVLSVASGLKLARKINDDQDLNDLELALLRSVLPEDIKDTLLYSYINEDDSVVRISTRVVETSDGLNRNNLITEIKNDLINEFKLEDDQITITGLAVLYNNMLQSLFSAQIGSIIIVFSVIGLMFLAIFKTFKAMIVGLIPNIFVAMSVLGVLGLLGLPLDIMTITVAAISVGMAVDNTIHYMYRYKKEYKNTKDPLTAINFTHTNVGRALFYTAATISIGFSILSFSNFFPTVLFGLFTSMALIISFVSSLTLLPNLLVKSKLFQ